MKLKRYISLLLATVYLFAVGGQAFASLSCHCVAEQSHICGCHHCAHQTDDIAVGNPEMNAPCCDDNHSTEVELYISADKSPLVKRIAILDLPYALVPQALVSCETLHTAAEYRSEHRSPLPQAAPRFTRGLRAPPVLA